MPKKKPAESVEPAVDTAPLDSNPTDAPPPVNDAQPSRQWTAPPDPFGALSVYWPDYKISLQFSRRFHEWQIRFNEGRPQDRPSDAVLAKVKELGFRWNTNERAWGIHERNMPPGQAHDHAQEAFAELVNLVEADRGPATGRGREEQGRAL